MALCKAIGHHDIEQFVTVVKTACRIDQLQAVSIAVERDTVICAVFLDRLNQRRGRGCTEAGVDVGPIWAAADGHDFGAQFVEHRRRYVIRRTMRSIDDDFQALQRQLAAKGTLAEFDVTTARVLELARLALASRGDPLRRLVQ